MKTYFNYFVYVVLNTFNFKGRAGLTEYWSYYATCLPFVLFTYFGLDSLSLKEGLIFFGFFLIWCIPTIALTVRRLHDVNYSGWYFIVCVLFTPFSLYIACKGSYFKENKWGEVPKEAPQITKKDIQKTGIILVIYLGLLAMLFLKKLVGENYQCDNSQAKEMILEEYMSGIERVIEEDFYYKHLNYEDISGYARANNLNYSDVIETEKKKLIFEFEKYKKEIFESVELKNILTTKIDKEIKKCECEGTIIYGDKQKNVIYSVQENADGEIYVEYFK